MALKTGLDSARSKLQNQCVEIVRAYRTSGAYGAPQGSGYQLQLPEALQLLPLYVVRGRFCSVRVSEKEKLMDIFVPLCGPDGAVEEPCVPRRHRPVGTHRRAETH